MGGNDSAASIYGLKCSKCNGVEGPRKADKIITCEGYCNQYFNLRCIDIMPGAFDVLSNHPHNFIFKCDECVSKPMSVSDLCVIVRDQSQLITSLVKAVEFLKSSHDDLLCKFDSLSVRHEVRDDESSESPSSNPVTGEESQGEASNEGVPDPKGRVSKRKRRGNRKRRKPRRTSNEGPKSSPKPSGRSPKSNGRSSNNSSDKNYQRKSRNQGSNNQGSFSGSYRSPRPVMNHGNGQNNQNIPFNPYHASQPPLFSQFSFMQPPPQMFSQPYLNGQNFMPMRQFGVYPY